MMAIKTMMKIVSITISPYIVAIALACGILVLYVLYPYKTIAVEFR